LQSQFPAHTLPAYTTTVAEALVIGLASVAWRWMIPDKQGAIFRIAHLYVPHSQKSIARKLLSIMNAEMLHFRALAGCG
jgi:hypothetical protein